MNGWKGLFACSACLALGIALGIGLILTRPSLLSRFRKKLGLQNANQQWFYSQTVAFHRRVDGCVPDGAVLFIGDSVIQGMCVTEVAANAINYGIGGDTTAGVLARLSEYQSLARASAVVICVGDNDLRTDLKEADVEANFRQILARMPERISVFFCSLTPTTRESGEALNPRILSLNRILQKVCGSRPDCHFVDLNENLTDGQGFLLVQYADSDGAHLNGRGSRVCIEKLRECLRPTAPHVEPAARNKSSL